MRRTVALTGLAHFSAASLCAQVGMIPDGFTYIFDGKTTKGWHISRTTRHGTTPNVFVENGELVLRQRPYGQGGLVFTDKRYRNFDLYLEVKAGWGCNSGLFLRSTEEGSAYQVELDQTRGMGALLGEDMRVSVGERPTEVAKV